MKKIIDIVYELELWSRPGQNLDQEFGTEELQETISRDLRLNKKAYIGLSYIPGEVYTKILEADIRERIIQPKGFLDYCNKYKLKPYQYDAVSAALYLEYFYGRGLAWLHLPCDQTGKSYLSILVDWAKKNGYAIVDTHHLFCVIDAEGWDEFIGSPPDET